MSTRTPCPTGGYVVKLTANGSRHYVNVCSHSSVGRPIDAMDREVSDEHLQLRGIDNLRVPLLTGAPRTHVIPNGEGEAICVDVVFNPASVQIAMVTDDVEMRKPGEPVPHAQAVALGKLVRMRLVELALKNAEEELGYPLGRNWTLPRGASYKGGVNGSNRPVPIPGLRILSDQLAAEARMAEMKKTAGPWRSKREAVGLDTRNAPKIVEMEQTDGSASRAETIRKGFLTGAGTKGSLYPNGSDEGMHPEGAGDPLGWMPKGLRSRVSVVDTATASQGQQTAAMEHYAATGKRLPETAAAAGGAAAPPSVGCGVKKGFLSSEKAAGKLYPGGSLEGGGTTGGGQQHARGEMEALRGMLPSEEELTRMAKETDPKQFLSELEALGSQLNLGGGLSSHERPRESPGTPHAAGSGPAVPPSLRPSGWADPLASGDNQHSEFEPPDLAELGVGASEIERRQREAEARARRRAMREAPQAPTPAASTGGAGSGEVEPLYELSEEGSAAEPVICLVVKLPKVDSLEGLVVDISDSALQLQAAGHYRLHLQWPRTVCSDAAKAKFLKKSRCLQLRMPVP